MAETPIGGWLVLGEISKADQRRGRSVIRARCPVCQRLSYLGTKRTTFQARCHCGVEYRVQVLGGE